MSGTNNWGTRKMSEQYLGRKLFYPKNIPIEKYFFRTVFKAKHILSEPYWRRNYLIILFHKLQIDIFDNVKRLITDEIMEFWNFNSTILFIFLNLNLCVYFHLRKWHRVNGNRRWIEFRWKCLPYEVRGRFWRDSFIGDRFCRSVRRC